MRRIACGRRYGSASEPSEADGQRVQEIFREHFHSQNEARFMERSEGQAGVLVRRLWPAIDRVARVLREKGEATAEECQPILKASLEQQARDRAERLNRAWQEALAKCGP